MPRCRHCNLNVSRFAEQCPRCGSPLPAQFRISIRGLVIVIMLFFILFAVPRSGGNSGSGRDGETVQIQTSPTPSSSRSANSSALSSAMTAQCLTGPGAPPCPIPWQGSVPAVGQGSSSQYKSNWQKIEADNGAVYDIDLNSIMRYNGMAEAMVYVVEGQYFNPMNLKQLFFDCRGHFMELTDAGLSPQIYAPPRSVAAQLATIACGGARSDP